MENNGRTTSVDQRRVGHPATLFARPTACVAPYCIVWRVTEVALRPSSVAPPGTEGNESKNAVSRPSVDPADETDSQDVGLADGGMP